MKITKFFLFSMLFFVLSSCFSQKIFLNNDKESGTLSLEYTFDDDDFEIISLVLPSIPMGEEIGTFDPSILISQEEFTNYFRSLELEEIQLKKAMITKKSISKTNSSYKGSIVIDFQKLESLLTKFPAAENGFKLRKEGNTRIFEQTLDLNTMGDIETLNNYIALVKEEKPQWHHRFVESNFLIEINTKTPILASRGVSVSSDKKKASYQFKTQDILGNTEKTLEFMVKF